MANVEALGIAREHFGDVIDEPVYTGLRLHPGERVADYLSDNVALVDLPGSDRRSVARSTLPLLTKGPDGEKVPIDPRLERQGGRLQPKAPVTAIALGQDSAGGINFVDAGVTVHPDAPTGTTAALVEDKLFFANVDTDTDLLELPVPGGAETFSVLRSSASPEDLGFDFDLPAGAELRHVPGRNGFPSGAQVVREGRLLLDVLPAQARDADGTPLPASYRIQGDRLVVHVSHRSAAVRYPILVDPTIRNGTETGGDWIGWKSIATSSGYTFDFNPVNFPSYGWKYGMRIRANGNPMTAGQYGNWYWKGPAKTWIYAADWRFVTFEWLFQVINAGVVTRSGTWETAGTQPNPQQLTRSYENHYMRFCFRSPIVCGAIPDGARDGDLDGNSMVFGMQTQVMGNFSSGVYANMQGADIYSHETYPPSVTAFSANTGSGWHDTDLATTSATYSAHDDGFGVWQYSVQSVAGIDAHRLGCDGQLNSACPIDTAGSTVAYPLAGFPEGVSNLEFWVTDPINNASPHRNWPIKIDRSKPSAPALSGSLWTHRNQTTDHREEGLYDASYTLNASAGDNGSGLKSIDVQVDSDPPFHYIPSCSGTDGCSGSIPPWTFNSDSYADGDHTITVTAKDQLADKAGIDSSRHTSTTSFQVTLDRRGDIYHGVGWEGDPATDYTTGEEYAQINTQNMRHLTDNTLVTRNVVTCVSDVQGCVQERSQTRGSQITPGASDDYTVTTGTSHNDERLADDSELLAPANSDLGAPTVVGPIRDGLQLWQRPPPAHGSTYSLYTTTEATVTDEQPADEVTKLWLDSATKMPLHVQTILGGVVESDLYYVYDRTRSTSAEVPGDFFAAPPPANGGQMDTDDLPLVELPEPDDPAPPSDADQIADAQALRTDLGLRNDFAYVEGLFNDVTLDNGADAYGIPLTPVERADLDARVAAEEDLDVVDDYGEDQAPNAFAGTYIDQQKGGAIYVGFTNNVAANMTAIKAIYPQPELLHSFPTTPERTLKQLDALQTQVENDIDAGTLLPLRVNSVGQNEEANKVIVTSPAPTDADRALLMARYGSGVALEEREEGTLLDTASNHRTPPNIGGLKIRSKQKYFGNPNIVRCTSGFGAVKYYNTNGHKGREYFDVSAGHCLVSTQEPGNSRRGYGIRWKHNKKLFGITITNTLVPAGRRTGSDAMSVQVQPGTQSNRIYVRTGKDAKPHLVRIKGSRSRIHRNQLICHAGFATRRVFCGRAKDRNVTDYAQGNGTVVVHGVEVKLSACGVHEGDSGGPAYRKHRAFGIVRRAFKDGRNCPSGSYNYFVFTKIGFGVADLGGLELLK